jgi:hypothetical protein
MKLKVGSFECKKTCGYKESYEEFYVALIIHSYII